MIRIRVVKASGIVFVAALAALLIALALLGAKWLREENRPATPAASSAIVERGAEEAAGAFAAAAPRVRELEFPDENEHSDPAAEGFIIEPLPLIQTPRPEPSAPPRGATPPAKTVLVYHTHTHESYQPEAEDPYTQEEPWRTSDPEHSVVAVGAALCRLLSERGIRTLHDVTDHEPPKLATAYARSLDTLSGYADRRFDLIIDLHRDAYSPSAIPVMRAYRAGQSCAQLMLLVGNGEGFNEKGDVSANLAFARALTEQLNRAQPGLCRDVMIKKGRYNQHMSTPAILVEVGHNLNTLTEAKNSMPPLADAIAALLT